MTAKHAEFTVFYDGPALRDNRMDVRDLAPALLALGDMLDCANQVVNGDKAAVKVQVKAFEAGSFGITLEIVQSCADVILNLFKEGTRIRDALELLSLLGFTVSGGGYGLYQLIKKFKGRNPTSIKSIEHNKVELTFNTFNMTAETVIVSEDVSKLYADKKVRDSAQATVSPLRQDGIDGLYIKTNGNPEHLVDKTEVDSFEIPFDEVPLTVDDEPQERVLSIVALSFKKDNKWKLSDGSVSFNVTITDQAFNSKVDNGHIDFANGDMLRVLMITRSFSSKTGLKTEYEVVKVLGHEKTARQLFLPIQ